MWHRFYCYSQLKFKLCWFCLKFGRWHHFVAFDFNKVVVDVFAFSFDEGDVVVAFIRVETNRETIMGSHWFSIVANVYFVQLRLRYYSSSNSKVNQRWHRFVWFLLVVIVNGGKVPMKVTMMPCLFMCNSNRGTLRQRVFFMWMWTIMLIYTIFITILNWSPSSSSNLLPSS